MNMENKFLCPLLDRDIDDGECYDIQLALGRYMKLSSLNIALNGENAKAVCTLCSFNQLPDVLE